MQDIIKKAEELGKAIARSDRYEALNKVRREADQDEGLQADLKALNEASEKIAQLEKETKPVEPEDKRKLQQLQQKVTGHARLQDLARAEADFAEMMNQVNRTIRSQFAEKPDQEDREE